MLSWVSRHLVHPLWDLKDGSRRLKTLRHLQRTQWLPESELRQIQQHRLRQMLVHAYDNTPYYRELFDRHGVDVRAGGLQALARIPVLTKRDIRANLDALIAKPYERASLSFHKTGGSTGTSLQVYFDEAWRQVRTADAMRANQWAGYFHGMPVAAIWGNPPLARTLRQRLRSALYDRFIYLDTMNLTETSLAAFVALWRRKRPQIVFGHSHSIYLFAKYLERHGITDLRPRGIISTSMMLLGAERTQIERTFACPVTDRYGCEEVGLIASQCELHGAYHLDIEHLYIEFLRSDGSQAVPGEEGAIIVTDLLNRAMPLIRYRLEDVGVPGAGPCPCGRGLPTMDRITGRVADYLHRRDGSLVAGVSLVERTLTAIAGIEQMQIVQPSLDELDINVVIAPEVRATAEAALRQELGKVFGQVRLNVNYMSGIAQDPSGKYRFAISRVTG